MWCGEGEARRRKAKDDYALATARSHLGSSLLRFVFVMQQFRRRWRRKVLVFAQWLLVRVNGGLLRVHTCIFWAGSLVFRCHQRLHTLVVEDISPEEGLLV